MMLRKSYVVVLFSLLACGPGGNESENTNLSPADFQGKLSGDIVLMDVRSPEELQSQYIAGAHNIDFKSPGFRNILTTLDKEQTYLVYCASGIRSGKAAGMMKELGFRQVFTLDGGMRSWNEAHLPAINATLLPTDLQLQAHGQSLYLVRGEESVAELICSQAVGEACLAYKVSLSNAAAADAPGEKLFYSRQEALDWVVGQLATK